MKIFKTKNYVPLACYETVYDIDYQTLYQSGKRIILLDLDNTLLSYDKLHPNQSLHDLFDHLREIQFFIIVISNNRKKRVALFADAIGCPFVASAKKPLSFGYRRALKRFKIDKDQVVCIGDQVLTDVLGAKRMGFDCILVHPLKRKSEKWFTKCNRRLEAFIKKRVLKKYPHAFDIKSGTNKI